jgi:Flp pilus assembly protein TadD
MAWEQSKMTYPCTDADLIKAGVALLRIDSSEKEAAERIFKTAVEINPENQDALHNLGAIQKNLGNHDAIKNLSRAVGLNPSSAISWAELADAYAHKEQRRDAMICGLRACDLNPDMAILWYKLAGLCEINLDFEQAEKCYAKALALQDDDVTARSWGMIKMLRGDYEHGLPLYERRLKDRTIQSMPVFTAPEAVHIRDHGQSVAIESEQGVGDLFMMSRYANMLRRHYKGEIILRCQPDLVPIMQRFMDFDAVLPQTEHDGLRDVRISSMSLPYLSRLLGEDMYQSMPLIDTTNLPTVDREGAKVVVGLCWAGNPRHQLNRYRSMTDISIKALIRAGNTSVKFLKLQPGEVRSDIDYLSNPDISTWEHTLGAILACDLVCTVDTAVAHLAGSLGKPVWLMLAALNDFRWGQESETTPWYPGMILFRQKELLRWQPVVEQVIKRLKKCYPESFAC